MNNASSTSLELEWTEPIHSATHGFIRYYAIRYRMVNCNASDATSLNSTWQNITVGADQRTTTLSNLSFWTCYDVAISAVTVGAGPYANATRIRTSENGELVFPFIHFMSF